MTVRFVVSGNPVGKGRARNGRGHNYTPEKTRKYEEAVRYEYISQSNKRFPDSSALFMTVLAFCPIPKTIRKVKVTAEMKEQMLAGKIRPMDKPDNSNILKAIEDSLNLVCYADDSHISDTIVRRYYSDNPRVDVTISEI